MGKKFGIKRSVKHENNSNSVISSFYVSFCKDAKLSVTKNTSKKFGISSLPDQSWVKVLKFIDKSHNDKKYFESRIRKTDSNDIWNDLQIIHVIVDKSCRLHGHFNNESSSFYVTRIDPNHNVHNK